MLDKADATEQRLRQKRERRSSLGNGPPALETAAGDDPLTALPGSARWVQAAPINVQPRVDILANRLPTISPGNSP